MLDNLDKEMEKMERTKKAASAVQRKEEDFGLNLVRGFVICCLYFTYQNSDHIQHTIDVMWNWLRHQWWYETVYNETFLVQIYSGPAYMPYRLLHSLNIGKKYRINGVGGNYELPTFREILTDMFDYTWPLVILDTFHVKHYAGVPDGVIAEKRTYWIQTSRALPESPPMLRDMVLHLIVALVLYDACFFLQHYLFHKNATLYRLFHKKHHSHESVNVRVTNRLHVVERIALVLSANFGLKLVGAHPLTRTIFIFVFVSILTENHSGYDLPYSYDKILPKGLIGGSRKHFKHHEYGTRNYQPIFTYLDGLLKLSKQNRWRKTEL
ncbi:putative methylsterol monooxygenase DDB_G0270946 [Clavelina lepadiformis]|uniref:putative methylsterol monooxygenase DDB_G0270946 n=1 Tax=Clavelina lepadiformis TaxID=159417 RepID=UPI004041AD5D